MAESKNHKECESCNEEVKSYMDFITNHKECIEEYLEHHGYKDIYENMIIELEVVK